MIQELIVDGILMVVIIACLILFKIASDNMTKKQKKNLKRIFIATVILLLVQTLGVKVFAYFGDNRWLRLSVYLLIYYIIGSDIVYKAYKGIKNGQVFDENFLMVVASLGALLLAIIQNGDYMEAIAVMLFYQVGEWFQSYAVGRSRKNITELMDIRPDYANIEVDGKITKVDPDEVKIGDTIIVKPGEKVPLDGIVIEGHSALDTAALTGESLPRDVKVDDEIISGCINMTGLLKIKTTKLFGESTVSKILDLVENASSRKSKSEDFIAKFARFYTPIVCYAALALAIIPPVFLYFSGNDPEVYTWIYRALSFLVASCPCALVISIPLSFFAGIGGASKEGILIKGSNFLETLSKTDTVVFDKTGTLTKGVFEVVAIHHNKKAKEELLYYAASAESASSHPISKSILKAYGKDIDTSKVKDIEEISGEGVKALVDGKVVLAGNDKLMKRFSVTYNDCHSIGTIVHIAIDEIYEGHIVIADIEKPNAKKAIEALKEANVKKTVMLTGDKEKVASKVANDLKIDAYYSELLPQDKVSKVETLLDDEKGGKLAFVGDGINDAPVLSRADIGIAMGAMGSDAAIEAADIVLMDDDPLKIAKAIKISKKCLRIVYQNIVFSIFIKIMTLILVALGFANMWLAVFADVGVMILAVLNAIRCLFVSKL